MARDDITMRVRQVGLSQSIINDANAAQRTLSRRPMKLTLDPKGFAMPLGRITGQMSEFQKSLDASAARVFAFGAAVGVINSVGNAFKALVKDSIELNKNLTELNSIFKLTSSNLQKFGSDLFDVARNTGQAFSEVSDAATEFSRQGLTAAETLKRLNDAMVLTRLSGLAATDSVKYLTAAINGFNKEALGSTDIVNRLANVDAAFAVSSRDLADAISRSGASAQAAKVEFNELLAIVTSVQQQTARGGAVIGNAFKTIFTRLQRSSVRSALEDIGVATENANGSLRSATAILRDYAKAYQSLTDQQRAYTAEQVAGVRQVNNLKALVTDMAGQYGIYNRALSTANNTTDQATRRNEEYNKTIAAMAHQTAMSVKEMSAAIGELTAGPGVERILGMIQSIADFFNKVLDPQEGNKLAQGFMKGIGAYIAGPGLILIGGAFLKLFTIMGKLGADAVKSIFAVNTETQRRRALEEAILQLLIKEENAMNKLQAAGVTQAQKEKIVLDLLRQQTAERQRQASFLASLSGLPGLKGVAVSKEGHVVGKTKRAASALKPRADGHVPNFSKLAKSMEVLQGVTLGAPKGIQAKDGRDAGGRYVYNTGEVKHSAKDLAHMGLNSKGRDMILPTYGAAKQENLKKLGGKLGMSSAVAEEIFMSASGFIPNFRKAPPREMTFTKGKGIVSGKQKGAQRVGSFAPNVGAVVSQAPKGMGHAFTAKGRVGLTNKVTKSLLGIGDYKGNYYADFSFPVGGLRQADFRAQLKKHFQFEEFVASLGFGAGNKPKMVHTNLESAMDKVGRNQGLGRIFEAAILQGLRMSDLPEEGTWDIPNWRAAKGKYTLGLPAKTKDVDVKYNIMESKGNKTVSTMFQKALTTRPYMKNMIAAKIRNHEGHTVSKRRATGFIPNFAAPPILTPRRMTNAQIEELSARQLSNMGGKLSQSPAGFNPSSSDFAYARKLVGQKKAEKIAGSIASAKNTKRLEAQRIIFGLTSPQTASVIAPTPGLRGIQQGEHDVPGFGKIKMGYRMFGYDKSGPAAQQMGNIESSVRNWSKNKATALSNLMTPGKHLFQKFASEGGISGAVGSIFETAVQMALRLPAFKKETGSFDYARGTGQVSHLKKGGLFPGLTGDWIDASINPTDKPHMFKKIFNSIVVGGGYFKKGKGGKFVTTGKKMPTIPSKGKGGRFGAGRPFTLADGFVPNFATWVWDSDVFSGSGKKPYPNALNKLLESGKPIDVAIGPSGAGKTYWGANKFGMDRFIKSDADLMQALKAGSGDRIMALSAMGETKAGGLSPMSKKLLEASMRTGGTREYLYKSNMQLLANRNMRLSGGAHSLDPRSTKQLAGVKRAPLNQFAFLSKLRKQYGVKIRKLNEGLIPNFAASIAAPNPFSAAGGGTPFRLPPGFSFSKPGWKDTLKKLPKNVLEKLKNLKDLSGLELVKLLQKYPALQKIDLNKIDDIVMPFFGGGFVPNFSTNIYDEIETAIDTERALSGAAAVGFDERLKATGSYGFGVYDPAKQGTLSNAINQHLGGGESLREAISNSALSQEAMTSGFATMGLSASGMIPNFAMSKQERKIQNRINEANAQLKRTDLSEGGRTHWEKQLAAGKKDMRKLIERKRKPSRRGGSTPQPTPSVTVPSATPGAAPETVGAGDPRAMERDAREQRKEMKKEQRAARAQMGGMAVSFLAPMIAEQIEVSNQETGAVKGGLQGLGMGALAPMMLGLNPVTIGIAAVVTGVMAWKGALEGAKESVEGITKDLDDENNKRRQLINSTDAYVQTQAKLNDAFRTGDLKNQLKLQQELAESFNNIIDPDVRAQIVGAAGDMEALGKVVANMGKTAEKREAISHVIKTAATLDEENENWMGGRGDGWGDRIGSEDLQGMGNELSRSVELTRDQIRAAYSQLAGGTMSDVRKVLLNTFKLTSKDVSRLTEALDFNELRTVVKTALNTEGSILQSTAKMNLAISGITTVVQNLAGELERAANSMNKNMGLVQESFKRMGKTLTTMRKASLGSARVQGSMTKNEATDSLMRFQEQLINKQSQLDTEKVLRDLLVETREMNAGSNVRERYDSVIAAMTENPMGFHGEAIKAILVRSDEQLKQMSTTLEDQTDAEKDTLFELQKINLNTQLSLIELRAQNLSQKKSEEVQRFASARQPFTVEEITSVIRNLFKEQTPSGTKIGPESEAEFFTRLQKADKTIKEKLGVETQNLISPYFRESLEKGGQFQDLFNVINFGKEMDMWTAAANERHDRKAQIDPTELFGGGAARVYAQNELLGPTSKGGMGWGLVFDALKEGKAVPPAGISIDEHLRHRNPLSGRTNYEEIRSVFLKSGMIKREREGEAGFEANLEIMIRRFLSMAENQYISKLSPEDRKKRIIEGERNVLERAIRQLKDEKKLDVKAISDLFGGKVKSTGEIIDTDESTLKMIKGIISGMSTVSTPELKELRDISSHTSTMAGLMSTFLGIADRQKAVAELQKQSQAARTTVQNNQALVQQEEARKMQALATGTMRAGVSRYEPAELYGDAVYGVVRAKRQQEKGMTPEHEQYAKGVYLVDTSGFDEGERILSPRERRILEKGVGAAPLSHPLGGLALGGVGPRAESMRSGEWIDRKQDPQDWFQKGGEFGRGDYMTAALLEGQLGPLFRPRKDLDGGSFFRLSEDEEGVFYGEKTQKQFSKGENVRATREHILQVAKEQRIPNAQQAVDLLLGEIKSPEEAKKRDPRTLVQNLARETETRGGMSVVATDFVKNLYQKTGKSFPTDPDEQKNVVKDFTTKLLKETLAAVLEEGVDQTRRFGHYGGDITQEKTEKTKADQRKAGIFALGDIPLDTPKFWQRAGEYMAGGDGQESDLPTALYPFVPKGGDVEAAIAPLIQLLQDLEGEDITQPIAEDFARWSKTLEVAQHISPQLGTTTTGPGRKASREAVRTFAGEVNQTLMSGGPQGQALGEPINIDNLLSSLDNKTGAAFQETASLLIMLLEKVKTTAINLEDPAEVKAQTKAQEDTLLKARMPAIDAEQANMTKFQNEVTTLRQEITDLAAQKGLTVPQNLTDVTAMTNFPKGGEIREKISQLIKASAGYSKSKVTMDKLRFDLVADVQAIRKSGDKMRESLAATSAILNDLPKDALSIAAALEKAAKILSGEIEPSKTPGAPKATGFIPNLAPDPVKRAMQTERAMGGAPQLDYDKRIGFAVIDKNNQSSIRDALSQHRSLGESPGQAIASSARYQGVANRGFVPNFQLTESTAVMNAMLGRLGVDNTPAAHRNMQRFLTRVGHVESDYRPNAQAGTTTASGVFQFTRGSAITAVNRMENLFEARGQTLPAWANDYRTRVRATAGNRDAYGRVAASLTDDQARALTLANFDQARGSDALLRPVIAGTNRGEDLYTRIHHTNPDAATQQRLTRGQFFGANPTSPGLQRALGSRRGFAAGFIPNFLAAKSSFVPNFAVVSGAEDTEAAKEWDEKLKKYLWADERSRNPKSSMTGGRSGAYEKAEKHWDLSDNIPELPTLAQEVLEDILKGSGWDAETQNKYRKKLEDRLAKPIRGVSLPSTHMRPQAAYAHSLDSLFFNRSRGSSFPKGDVKNELAHFISANILREDRHLPGFSKEGASGMRSATVELFREWYANEMSRWKRNDGTIDGESLMIQVEDLVLRERLYASKKGGELLTLGGRKDRDQRVISVFPEIMEEVAASFGHKLNWAKRGGFLGGQSWNPSRGSYKELSARQTELIKSKKYKAGWVDVGDGEGIDPHGSMKKYWESKGKKPPKWYTDNQRKRGFYQPPEESLSTIIDYITAQRDRGAALGVGGSVRGGSSGPTSAAALTPPPVAKGGKLQLFGPQAKTGPFQITPEKVAQWEKEWNALPTDQKKPEGFAWLQHVKKVLADRELEQAFAATRKGYTVEGERFLVGMMEGKSVLDDEGNEVGGAIGAAVASHQLKALRDRELFRRQGIWHREALAKYVGPEGKPTASTFTPKHLPNITNKQNLTGYAAVSAYMADQAHHWRNSGPLHDSIKKKRHDKAKKDLAESEERRKMAAEGRIREGDKRAIMFANQTLLDAGYTPEQLKGVGFDTDRFIRAMPREIDPKNPEYIEAKEEWLASARESNKRLGLGKLDEWRSARTFDEMWKNRGQTVRHGGAYDPDEAEKVRTITDRIAGEMQELRRKRAAVKSGRRMKGDTGPSEFDFLTEQVAQIQAQQTERRDRRKPIGYDRKKILSEWQLNTYGPKTKEVEEKVKSGEWKKDKDGVVWRFPLPPIKPVHKDPRQGLVAAGMSGSIAEAFRQGKRVIFPKEGDLESAANVAAWTAEFDALFEEQPLLISMGEEIEGLDRQIREAESDPDQSPLVADLGARRSELAAKYNRGQELLRLLDAAERQREKFIENQMGAVDEREILPMLRNVAVKSQTDEEGFPAWWKGLPEGAREELKSNFQTLSGAGIEGAYGNRFADDPAFALNLLSNKSQGEIKKFGRRAVVDASVMGSGQDREALDKFLDEKKKGLLKPKDFEDAYKSKGDFAALEESTKMAMEARRVEMLMDAGRLDDWLRNTPTSKIEELLAMPHIKRNKDDPQGWSRRTKQKVKTSLQTLLSKNVDGGALGMGIGMGQRRHELWGQGEANRWEELLGLMETQEIVDKTAFIENLAKNNMLGTYLQDPANRERKDELIRHIQLHASDFKGGRFVGDRFVSSVAPDSNLLNTILTEVGKDVPELIGGDQMEKLIKDEALKDKQIKYVKGLARRGALAPAMMRQQVDADGKKLGLDVTQIGQLIKFNPSSFRDVADTPTMKLFLSGKGEESLGIGKTGGTMLALLASLQDGSFMAKFNSLTPDQRNKAVQQIHNLNDITGTKLVSPQLKKKITEKLLLDQGIEVDYTGKPKLQIGDFESYDDFWDAKAARREQFKRDEYLRKTGGKFASFDEALAARTAKFKKRATGKKRGDDAIAKDRAVEDRLNRGLDAVPAVQGLAGGFIPNFKSLEDEDKWRNLNRMAQAGASMEELMAEVNRVKATPTSNELSVGKASAKKRAEVKEKVKQARGKQPLSPWAERKQKFQQIDRSAQMEAVLSQKPKEGFFKTLGQKLTGKKPWGGENINLTLDHDILLGGTNKETKGKIKDLRAMYAPGANISNKVIMEAAKSIEVAGSSAGYVEGGIFGQKKLTASAGQKTAESNIGERIAQLEARGKMKRGGLSVREKNRLRSLKLSQQGAFKAVDFGIPLPQAKLKDASAHLGLQAGKRRIPLGGLRSGTLDAKGATSARAEYNIQPLRPLKWIGEKLGIVDKEKAAYLNLKTAIDINKGLDAMTQQRRWELLEAQEATGQFGAAPLHPPIKDFSKLSRSQGFIPNLSRKMAEIVANRDIGQAGVKESQVENIKLNGQNSTYVARGKWAEKVVQTNLSSDPFVVPAKPQHSEYDREMAKQGLSPIQRNQIFTAAQGFVPNFQAAGNVGIDGLDSLRELLNNMMESVGEFIGAAAEGIHTTVENTMALTVDGIDSGAIAGAVQGAVENTVSDVTSAKVNEAFNNNDPFSEIAQPPTNTPRLNQPGNDGSS